MACLNNVVLECDWSDEDIGVSDMDVKSDGSAFFSESDEETFGGPLYHELNVESSRVEENKRPDQVDEKSSDICGEFGFLNKSLELPVLVPRLIVPINESHASFSAEKLKKRSFKKTDEELDPDWEPCKLYKKYDEKKHP
ncbi:hypothetical protein QAD02_007055 [Eretmocerus hayati]|uniref:Uncharacterized protein n=1 Tax=Eretmocerus hayati TaxID=131215 RepID=A0ACC2N2L4_9HYME|nr:hypothetical protein QAD02_007055 [Eretmocerus hayati]